MERQLHMGCGETLDPQVREWLGERARKHVSPRKAMAARSGHRPERAR